MQDYNTTAKRRSKRLRSPQDRGYDRKNGEDVKRRRSRSPHSRKHHHDKRQKLPYRSPHLHKHDFDAYKNLFADYLELQKDLDLAGLDDHEAQGRWRSFLNKWNRGELAEGWYDPETRQKADNRSKASARPSPPSRPVRTSNVPAVTAEAPDSNDDDEDDDIGPALPSTGTKSRYGPTAPGFQDLQHSRELAEEDRVNQRADLRYERKQDRKAQKEHLEELVPRAAPGSRERQLEKKRDVAMSNRAFADAKDAGTEDVGENELMGDDGIDGYKAKKKAAERQKSEREMRKEEILRAREVEREERLAEHRKKEDKTMEYLKSLAQQRYGGGA